MSETASGRCWKAVIDGGGVVVVLREAGIGKTALVASVARGRHALWGACDPLITPRPLGPLRDVADQVGDEFARTVADDATLDVIALLGRRLAAGPPRPAPTPPLRPPLRPAAPPPRDSPRLQGRPAASLA